MKYSLYILPLIASVALAGCKPATDRNATSTTQATVSSQAAAASTSTQNAKVYTFEQKADYVAAMKAQLAEINKSLDEISAKVEKSNEPIKSDAAKKLAALRAQAVQMDKQLQAVNGSTPSTWDGIKNDSEKLYVTLKDGLTQSRQWVSDKIAP